MEVGQGNEAGLSVPINNLGIARFTVKLDAINRRKQKVSQRVGSLWTNKNMLVIDEISMVSSKLMDSVDKQCNAMKNLDSSSTAVFGGLPVVIALGDFHQFPPVRARALWQKQESHDEKRGQQLWYMFKNVVVLDEQMRQQQDIDYYQLLQRVRNGTVTQAGVDGRPVKYQSCVSTTGRIGTWSENGLHRTEEQAAPHDQQVANGKIRAIKTSENLHLSGTPYETEEDQKMARSKHRSAVGASRQFRDERSWSADVHAGHACAHAFQCCHAPRNR